MDYFQEFEKQREITEGVFDKLFPKSGKQEVNSNEAHLKQYGFYRAEDGTFIFGDGNVVEKINNNEYTLESFLEKLNIPKNPKLNFLVAPGTKFHAKYLKISPSTGELEDFEGEWNVGHFHGGIFRGVFRGNSFKGDFYGDNADYQAPGREIISFVDGTFIDGTNSGILGLPNTLNTDNENFNFITIPVGYTLRYVSKSGVEGYIKVLKRLDGVNSRFSYEVLDGFAGHTSPQNFNLDWPYFRNNAASGIFDINVKNTVNIAGLVRVPAGDSIKEMYISAAPANLKQKGTSHPGRNAFNLSVLPYLNIKSMRNETGQFVKPEVILALDSNEELQQLDYINSGTLKQDIKNLAKAVKYKEVDGYGPFNYLSAIFNNNPGVNVFNLLKKPLAEAGGVMGQPKFDIPSDTGRPSTYRPRKTSFGQFTTSAKPTPLPKVEEPKFGTIPSMKRLNDFIRYFVENIVHKNGEANEDVQSLIINRLKTALGTDKEITQVPATPQPGAQNVPQTSAISKAKERLDEALRNRVRNIINDSF